MMITDGHNNGNILGRGMVSFSWDRFAPDGHPSNFLFPPILPSSATTGHDMIPLSPSTVLCDRERSLPLSPSTFEAEQSSPSLFPRHPFLSLSHTTIEGIEELQRIVRFPGWTMCIQWQALVMDTLRLSLLLMVTQKPINTPMMSELITSTVAFCYNCHTYLRLEQQSIWILIVPIISSWCSGLWITMLILIVLLDLS